MVIGGAVEAGQPWVAAVFVIGAVMTVQYLLRAFARVFLGKPGDAANGVREGSASMVATVVSLGALSIASGLLVAFPASFVSAIVQQMAVIVK